MTYELEKKLKMACDVFEYNPREFQILAEKHSKNEVEKGKSSDDLQKSQMLAEYILMLEAASRFSRHCELKKDWLHYSIIGLTPRHQSVLSWITIDKLACSEVTRYFCGYD